MEEGKVFKELKKEILSLKLRPGEELSLNELSVLYGVSRSPVRDAVRELKAEGLVDVFPQKGTYVSRISIGRAEDERFIRLHLELGAMEKFMERKNEADEMELENLIAEQEKAFSLRDTNALLSLDDSFHEVFFQSAGKGRVFAFVEANSGSYHRMRAISFMFDGIAKEAIEQHKALLKAVKASDAEAAAEIDRRHMSKLLYETESFRNEMPQYFAD